MLGRDTEPLSDSAIDAVKNRSACQLRRCSLVVKSLVQVETPIYESNHRTAFINWSRGFCVLSREKLLALIASRIKGVRVRLGLNQVEFARKLGLDQTTVSKWERARAVPTPNALIRIGSLAEDGDKLFFLEHAGLPAQFFGGDAMIPEIKDASEKVVKKAFGLPDSPQKNISWDREVLIFVIETIDRELKKRGKKLRSRKYAEMVVLSYEYCVQSGKQDAEIVGRLLKIA